ncbi:hypothetical protein T439DRAFT_323099, partial [Meredithblackwellia eburnea MCA 4105]
MSIYPPLAGNLYGTSLALGTMLFGAGFRYTFDQKGTSGTFGVAPSVSVSPQRGVKAGDFYLSVAGSRNFFIGLNIIAFALLRDRRATGVAVAVTVLVPILDGYYAFRHAATPLKCALQHWVGGALTAFLGYKLLVL